MGLFERKKKEMKKRLLTGLFMSVFVAVMLTGCGGKKNITKMTDEELGEYVNGMSVEEYDKFMLNLSPEEQERYDRYLYDTLEVSYTEDDSAGGRDDDFDDQGYFEEDSEETGDADTEDAAQQEVIEPTDEILDADWTDFKIQVDHNMVTFDYPMTVSEFLGQFDSVEYGTEDNLEGLCNAGDSIQIEIRNNTLEMNSFKNFKPLYMFAENQTDDILRVKDCTISEVHIYPTYDGYIYYPKGLKGDNHMLEGDENYSYDMLQNYVEPLVDQVDYEVKDPKNIFLRDDISLAGKSVAFIRNDIWNENTFTIRAWSENIVGTYDGGYKTEDLYLQADFGYYLNMDAATYYNPHLLWSIESVQRN